MARFVETLASATRRLRADRRGSVAVLYAVTLPLVVGFIGLGVEVGYWYWQRQQLQSASDAAAFAGALSLETGGNATEALAAADAAARRAGYSGAALAAPNNFQGPGVVDASLPAEVQSGGVRVLLTQQQELLFSQVVFDGGVTVAAASVAGAGRYYAQNCIVGLDTTANVDAVLFNGAALSIPSGCGVHANSNFTVTGNNTGVAALSVSTTGSYTGVQPASLSQGVQAYKDPYADKGFSSYSPACTAGAVIAGNEPVTETEAVRLASPVSESGRRLVSLRGSSLFAAGAKPYVVQVTQSSGASNGNANGAGNGNVNSSSSSSSGSSSSGTATNYDATGLSDRTMVFCGANHFHTDATFVGPAIYVFNGGFEPGNYTISLAANPTDGIVHGVTFIFLNANINVTGHPSIQIKAPTQAEVDALSGAAKTAMSPWVGIAMYSPDSSADFGGTVSMQIDGSLYFPNAEPLDLGGNLASGSTDCTRVFSKRVRVHGSVAIGAANCTAYPSANTYRIRPALYK